MAELFLELSQYHRENWGRSVDAPIDRRLGFFGANYLQAMCAQPVGMRVHSEEYWTGQWHRAGLRRSAWEAYLRAECETLGFHSCGCVVQHPVSLFVS